MGKELLDEKDKKLIEKCSKEDKWDKPSVWIFAAIWIFGFTTFAYIKNDINLPVIFLVTCFTEGIRQTLNKKRLLKIVDKLLQ